MNFFVGNYTRNRRLILKLLVARKSPHYIELDVSHALSILIRKTNNRQQRGRIEKKFQRGGGGGGNALLSDDEINSGRFCEPLKFDYNTEIATNVCLKR